MQFDKRGLCFLRIYKTLIRSPMNYFTFALVPVSTHENWTVILKLVDMQRRVAKIIKNIKTLQLQGVFGKIGINHFIINKKDRESN